MIGSKLGSYEVEEEIGRGGMGVVYRAYQPNLQRRVAVKVLLSHLAEDADFVERFMREARAAAKLHHPGLVTIFDVGEFEGTYFFSMQWLQGKTLEQKLEEPGDLSVTDAVSVVTQMASALGYAHEAGVVHRDVKPANVMVDDAGRAVLTDFGIAQAGNETRLTRVGSSVGSPDFMAPEQISAGDIDARSDLYSLGILLHNLLTGEPPYTGDAPIAVAYQHLNAPVPSVREKRPEIPPELDDVVRRMMAKAPEDRFQTADELLAALHAIPDLEISSPLTGIGSVPIIGSDRPAREEVEPEPEAAAASAGSRVGRVALVAVAALLIGGGIYWWMNRQVTAEPDTERLAAAAVGEQVVPVDEEAAAETPAAAATEQPAETTEDPAVPPQTAAPPAEPEVEGFSGSVEIRPDLADLEVWLDGRDQELTTPAVLGLEGLVGDERTVELRRGGEVLASLGLTLGPEMEDRWSPALRPPDETITVSSQPAGARVTLDGALLEEVTPVAVTLEPGRDYQLGLTRDGYEPAGWGFDLDRLTSEQRESGSLHFVLTASIVPAELVVVASYPITVEVAGQQQSGEGEIRLSVPPGDHTVELSAPGVFYGESRNVVLESEQSRTLQLPETVTIPVAAEGRCRLSIDGLEVGDLPARVELTIGAHTFRFEWEGGLVKEQRHNIGRSTQRIYEVKPA